jgi:hypothetical protein
MATQASTNLLPGSLAIGGDCCIEILDNAGYTRWVVDCAGLGLVDLYFFRGHGLVGAPERLAQSDCPCMTPVEDATCSGIKVISQ